MHKAKDRTGIVESIGTERYGAGFTREVTGGRNPLNDWGADGGGGRRCEGWTALVSTLTLTGGIIRIEYVGFAHQIAELVTHRPQERSTGGVAVKVPMALIVEVQGACILHH